LELLTNNISLATTGLITWDGTNEDGHKANNRHLHNSAGSFLFAGHANPVEGNMSGCRTFRIIKSHIGVIEINRLPVSSQFSSSYSVLFPVRLDFAILFTG
jgi:hypothetical protein